MSRARSNERVDDRRTFAEDRSPEHLLHLGEIHMSAENYGDAMAAFQAAVERLSSDCPRDAIDARLRVVACLVARGELPEAERHLGEVSGAVATLPEVELGDDVRARIDAARGILFTKLGRYDDAIAHCRAAVARLDDVDTTSAHRVRAEVFLFLGQSLERLGDTPNAGRAFENALRLYERIGDRRGVSHAFNNLGLNRKQQHRFREAIALLRRALDVLDDVGEYPGRARICLNLGIVYLRIGEWQEAKPLLDRAVQISREIDNRWTQCKALLALGQLGIVCRRFADAKRDLSAAAELARRGGYRRDAVLAREFEAERLTCLGRAQDALGLLDEAWRDLETFAPRSDLAVEVLRRQADAFISLGHVNRASEAARRCSEIAASLGDHTETTACDRVHVLVAARNGEFAVARRQLDGVVAAFERHGLRYELAKTYTQFLQAVGESGSVSRATLAGCIEVAERARDVVDPLDVPGQRAALELAVAACALAAGDRELADRHLKAAGPHVEASDDGRLLERQLRLRACVDGACDQAANGRGGGGVTGRELDRACRGTSLTESMGGLLDLLLRKTNSDRAVLYRGETPGAMTTVAVAGEVSGDSLLNAVGPLLVEIVDDGQVRVRSRESLADIVAAHPALRDVSALALLPLCLPNEVWGVVILVRSASHVLGEYRASDLRLFPVLAELATVSVLSIDRAETYRERELQRERQAEDGLTQPLVYRSEAMDAVLRTVRKVADSPARVLLVGETGSGKGILSRAIHDLGASRRDKPFVHVNCAALPEQLLESELFGHVSGAFTGANRTKVGLFEEADGGTIFLDEIDKASLAVQAKLLHVLDHREIRPVGANQWRTVDARIVTATNADLPAAIERGTFLRDLFYRLNDITIQIPPLRERADDIEPLARHFARRVAAEMGSDVVELTREFVSRLEAHAWPGNVRELEKVVRRAVVLADDAARVTVDLLPADFTGRAAAAVGATSLKAAVRSLERQLIADTLDATGGNKSEAARRLGVSYPTLLTKVRAFGLDVER